MPPRFSFNNELTSSVNVTIIVIVIGDITILLFYHTHFAGNSNARKKHEKVMKKFKQLKPKVETHFHLPSILKLKPPIF
jgi:hypothetical protein